MDLIAKETRDTGVTAMPESSLDRLLDLRSSLVTEVRAYLAKVITDAAELPTYFPSHLRGGNNGQTGFASIQQQVQVIEDRPAWDQYQWQAADREQDRAAGWFDEHRAYAPNRARPEHGEDDERRDHREGDRPAPPPPVPWDEHAAERFPRAVILGDPGMGKSWFLRIEARRLALDGLTRLNDRSTTVNEILVPIFVTLPDLNRKRLPPEQPPTILDTLIKLVHAGSSRMFLDWLKNRMSRGYAAVLLDALDEVPDEPPVPGQRIENKRGYQQELRHRVGEFADAEDEEYSRCRLLITSRIVGYVGSPVKGAQELELTAFDGPQIEGFARAWFDQAELACFLTMLEQRPSMRGQARIPLLLTLMCRAFQEKKLAFPTRRVDLYDRCLWGLLRDWKQEKEAREVPNLVVDRHIELLADAALALFKGNKDQFQEKDLKDALTGLKNDENPIDLIAGWKHDGLLVRSRQDEDAPYLFLHRTFQEYLAALGLKRWGWGRIKDFVDRKSWLPRWQEVIVMLAGLIDDPTPLLELLADGNHDDLFRHRLALAARALPEAVNLEFHKNLAEQVTNEVLEIWKKYARLDAVSAIDPLVRAFPALAMGGKNIAFLNNVSSCIEVEDINHRSNPALDALVGIGASASPALPMLVKLLDNQHPSVFSGATDALAGISRADSTLLQKMRALRIEVADLESKLVNLLTHPHPDVRSGAAKALGAIGPAATSAVPNLLGLLCDEGWRVADNVSEALLRIDCAQTIDNSLLTSFLDHDSVTTRIFAVRALGKRGHAASPAKDALIRRLKDCSAGVVFHAADSLDRVCLSASVTTSLLVELLDDHLWSVCVHAARALAKRRPAKLKDIYRLIEILVEEDLNMHIRGLESDSQIGFILASFFANHTSNALRDLGPAARTEVSVWTGHNRLEHTDWRVRFMAAKMLGGSRSGESLLVDNLIQLLADHDWRVRFVAAKELGNLGSASDSAVLGLIQRLGDPEWHVRHAAIEALGRLASRTALVVDNVDKLTELLGCDSRLEVVLLHALGNCGPGAARSSLPLFINFLDRYCYKVEFSTNPGSFILISMIDVPLSEHIHIAAVYAIGKLGLEAHSAVPRLIELLGDMREILRVEVSNSLANMMAQGLRIFGDSLKDTSSLRIRTVNELAENP